ncbi:beta-ketoacyl synthase chain length factor [Halorhodospira sp. 9622]|uniref:beta-ketoacyl synthase chain length factor n=1 Tax=Halorhodospira sp. 9622 TaxID=2899136 RepID=UPI001EE79D4E|nr:beta-ketoacyl synthase chain length factor [Halorhodospira sp. 9622]MCG5537204.1 beta-ketoacyl synthase chain length factor [Halorhodospira sp. 9622]
MEASIQGVGLLGPGLAGWPASREILAGDRPWQNEPVGRLNAPGLPRTEARRATRATHLALSTASEALSTAPNHATEHLASVWAAADSDLQGLEKNMRTLAEDPPWISPHQFQNSVHNAPAGYWSIASGCRGPATALAAGEESFAAGLVEALTFLASGEEHALLVAYEEASPPLLEQSRPLPFSFSVALLLGQPGQRGAAVTLSVGARRAPTGCRTPELETLRHQSPAARSLPLLEALAGGPAAKGGIELAWGDHSLNLSIGAAP